MSISALLVLPGEPANPVILRRCYSGDIPDLHEFTTLASARQSTDGPTSRDRQPRKAGIIEHADETSWPFSTRWLCSRAGRHGCARNPPAVSGNERRDLSHPRIAGRGLAVLLAGRATFSLCAGRRSGALAAACGDNFRHFRIVSIARLGFVAGRSARAPASAVVWSVVRLRSAVHRAVLDRLDLDRQRQRRRGSLFGGRLQSRRDVSLPDF